RALADVSASRVTRSRVCCAREAPRNIRQSLPSIASRMLGASVPRGVEGEVPAAAEHDAGDATGHRPPYDGRMPGEQAERAAIVRQHVGAELIDAALLSDRKSVV